MAVGGEARRRRALRDARNDVFEDGDGCVGDGGGGVVVARRAGMMCASVLVASAPSPEAKRRVPVVAHPGGRSRYPRGSRAATRRGVVAAPPGMTTIAP